MKLTEHIDFRNGAFGCAVSVLFLLFFTLVVIVTFQSWSYFAPVEVMKWLRLLGWLFALALGGYAAVWKRQLTESSNWTSALAVGLLAELFLLAILAIASRSNAHSRTNALTFAERLYEYPSEVVNMLATRWDMTIMLALSIPAALVGGALSNRYRSDVNKGIGN